MSNKEKTVVGGIGSESATEPLAPRLFTRVTWLIWLMSVGVLALYVGGVSLPAVEGFVAADGLTVVMWSLVTFMSAVIQSYSRRYMSGNRRSSRFFAYVFGFTVAVLVLVAAESLVLFVVAWLAMGVVMAELVGFVRGWKQARASARLARRSFFLSTTLVSVGFVLLWSETGATTVSELVTSVGSVSLSIYYVAVLCLLGAAVVQSALVPFHGWLLSSMTAPTPASALMHAGFVNAGGVLLARFASVFSESLAVMTTVVVVGALSAVAGKLMKSVRPDIKGKLGCSTTGQMGFMVMQAGLGFFSAAVTHLILHAFYKAYMFMSACDRVEQTAPDRWKGGDVGVSGVVVAAVVGTAGGLFFVALTGKGGVGDVGIILTLLVVLTAGHATVTVVGSPATFAAKAVAPFVFLVAVAVYAVVYNFVTAVISTGTPFSVAEATALTPVHVAVAAVFVAAYVGIEFGYVRRSRRLYVKLLNASQPEHDTVTTRKEEYDV